MNNNKNYRAFPLLFAVFAIFFLNNCKEKEDDILTKPVLTTSSVRSITETTAKCGGLITSDGGSVIWGRGVCWDITPAPTIEDNKTSDATGKGEFISSVLGLKPNTIYYIRAYATNKTGTAYGLQTSFTTKAIVRIPFSVSTLPIKYISSFSAKSGGVITSDCATLTLTARGVCWNTVPFPTVNGSNSYDGMELGSYTSEMKNLLAGTTYYVRAYAIDQVGAIYGEQVSFTTLKTLSSE